MAVSVTHAFVSALSDDAADAAAGKVVPSNWNAEHDVVGVEFVYNVQDYGAACDGATDDAAAVSKAANSTDKGTKAGAYYNATAEGIVITPDTVPTDNTGRVRVTIHYLEVTPPAS